MKAFKGFKRDLTCRDVQYAEGETHTVIGPIALCSSGVHACLLPLDTLSYYAPHDSVYHAVELDGVAADRRGDSKVVARSVTVGARLLIAGLVDAQINVVRESATTTSGYGAHSVTSGYGAHSATSGDYANSATSGYGANSATSGYGANSATSGYGATRAEVKSAGSVAAVLGTGAAAGGLGCWLVLTERDRDLNILGVQAVSVDGETVKPGVFYELRDGSVQPVADGAS